MFNIGFTESLFLGVIVLIFIGPKELPEVARTIGRLFNELKRSTESFKSEITKNTLDIKPPSIHDVLSEKKKDEDNRGS